VSSSVPPDFTVPEAVRPIVDQIRNRYSLTADVIAGELYTAGLPHEQANTVAVDMLIEWACELAMINAVVLGNRQPSLARWQEITADKFQLAASRYAQAPFLWIGMDFGRDIGGEQ
jgi:hypothetical protein